MSDLVAIAEAVVAEINTQAAAGTWAGVSFRPAEFAYDPEVDLAEISADGPRVMVSPEATSTEPNTRGALQRLCTVAIGVVAKVESNAQDEVSPWLTFIDALADWFMLGANSGDGFRLASPASACIAARTILNLGNLRQTLMFSGTVELDFIVMESAS